MDYFAALRSFVRAVELGSFSRAAEEAGIKVSTVSRHVSGLEADLGAAVLNRSTRSLHLTEAGQLFYNHAVRILLDLQEAREATRSLNARPQGLLRIALPGAFGRRHVMPHMPDFLEAHPEIRLDVVIADTSIDLIEAGVDAAVRVGAMTDSALIARRLAPESLTLVSAPAYLRGRAQLQSPLDLPSHECLLSDGQGGKIWRFRSAPGLSDPTSSVEVDGRIRTSDLESLREAVLNGAGIALLPVWLCHSDLRDGRLCTVLPEFTWLPPVGPERAIWGLYPPKKIVSPKVKAFLAFLSSRYARSPCWDISSFSGSPET